MHVMANLNCYNICTVERHKQEMAEFVNTPSYGNDTLHFLISFTSDFKIFKYLSHISKELPHQYVVK